MSTADRDVYIWLSYITTFRNQDIAKLTRLFPTPEELKNSLTDKDILEHLVHSGIIKPETKQELLELTIGKCLENAEHNMAHYNIHCTTIIDPDYPARLLNIQDAPPCLYYKGSLRLSETEHTIGIVGSRRPTHYGLAVADEFAKGLTDKSILIVSGMAYGIDSRAHQSAIDNKGKTIAVLGGGLDICYPRTSIGLYTRLCDEHLVLSEYPPLSKHLPQHFPRRNRIISGLSDGLLVVEAALRSGTLITADFALEQGKSIYAVPGRTTDMMSRGVNNLIKQGATLVDSPSDIIMDITGIPLRKAPRNVSNITNTALANNLCAKNSVSADIIHRKNGVSVNNIHAKNSVSANNITGTETASECTNHFPEKHNKNEITELSVTEKNILKMLGFEPVYIDDIIRANNMNITETIHILRILEEKGLVEAVEQSYYILRR